MKTKEWLVNRVKVQRVSPDFLLRVIERRTPYGCFLAREDCCWVAVDNSTGDAWTEDFPRKRQAVRWLQGEFEVGYKAKHWARISKAGELIAAARKQDVELDTKEADMILGYLEGHDYCLMADDEGVTVRHDEQYGDRHRGDEPYAVQEAIEFCQEMNEDLLREASSPNERDEEYLAELRKDEQLLDALMARLLRHPTFIGEV